MLCSQWKSVLCNSRWTIGRVRNAHMCRLRFKRVTVRACTQPHTHKTLNHERLCFILLPLHSVCCVYFFCLDLLYVQTNLDSKIYIHLYDCHMHFYSCRFELSSIARPSRDFYNLLAMQQTNSIANPFSCSPLIIKIAYKNPCHFCITKLMFNSNYK